MNYLPILVFIIMAILFVIFAITIGFAFGKRKINTIKEESYECGIEAKDSAHKPFPVKFFLIAVLFLLFDIETVFFFPWALSLRKIDMAGFFIMLIFIAILAIGYIFELKKINF